LPFFNLLFGFKSESGSCFIQENQRHYIISFFLLLFCSNNAAGVTALIILRKNQALVDVGLNVVHAAVSLLHSDAAHTVLGVMSNLFFNDLLFGAVGIRCHDSAYFSFEAH
jgi:hypothetical protein